MLCAPPPVRKPPQPPVSKAVISPASIPTPTTTTLPPPQQLPSSQFRSHSLHLANAGLPPLPPPPSSQRKEAPAFVRPFEDSFQPNKPSPSVARKLPTPPPLPPPPPPPLPLPSLPPPVIVNAPAAPSMPALVATPPQEAEPLESVTLCVPHVPRPATPSCDVKPPPDLAMLPDNSVMNVPETLSMKPADIVIVPDKSTVPKLPDKSGKVLNVPDKAKVLAVVKESALASWDYHAVSKSIAALKEEEAATTCVVVTSKLDLAERKRRERRLKVNGSLRDEERKALPLLSAINGNCNLLTAATSTVSSESELEYDSDTAECAVNGVLLTKGPPAKLDASPTKLNFLQTFGLTTLATKNDLELAKLERRHARHWERCAPILELNLGEGPGEGGACPELPHPTMSPDSLTRTADYTAKARFLRFLCLDPMPRKKREELELVWEAVVAERMRRNSVNTVVLYTHRQPHDFRRGLKTTSPSRVTLTTSPSRVVMTPLTVPRPARTVSPSHNGVVRAPLLNFVLRRHEPELSEEEEPPAKVMRWPGLEEVMEAFQRYHQEKRLEERVLHEQCSTLHQLLLDKRHQAEALDVRMRELVARRSIQDHERQEIQAALDKLNTCVRHVR